MNDYFRASLSSQQEQADVRQKNSARKKERREKRCGGKGKTKEKEKEKGKGRARSCRQLSFAQHKRTQKKPWEQGTAGRPTPSSPFLHLTAYPLGPSLDKQRQRCCF